MIRLNFPESLLSRFLRERRRTVTATRGIASLKMLLLTAVCGLVPIGQSLVAAPPEGSFVLPDFELTDFRGRRWTQADFQEAPLLAVAFMGTECPLAKLYASRLRQLDEQFGDALQVLFVMSNKQDSLLEIQNYAKKHELTFPVVKDAGNRFADALGAERTPEVYLFDGARQLRYWGRIDDQYGIGTARDEPRNHDLKDAIVAVQSGRNPTPSRTRSVGCIIGRARAIDPNAEVTFTSHVAAILENRCVQCHRDGEIAPFALTEYEEAAGWAEMLVETVDSGRMPPWHADPNHGVFSNSQQMPDEEKELLRKWADAGAPKGDGEATIQPPPVAAGWQLPRQPDLVIPLTEEPVQIPANGTVEYKYYRFIPDEQKYPELQTDQWLTAAELRPGNRAVVHHILCFARPRNSAGGLAAARSFLVGYVPGARLEMSPEGMAKRIPAGSELIFQVHYTPVGSPQEDQSHLGLVFADPDKITHEVKTYSVVEGRLNIPPGESDHAVTASTGLEDGLLLGMSPHMHLRGKKFRYTLARGDQRKILLDIPNYDFNWQTTYMLAEPLPIKATDRMICDAVYDNSEGNPFNPDPDATVRWGDQTDDEMMIGYYHYAVPIEKAKTANAAAPATLRQRLRRSGTLRVFVALDTDNDDRVERSETPAKYHEAFDRLDRNGDQVLTRQEVESS